MAYVVTAALVNLRAKDSNGVDVLRGFYAGAVLPEGINADDLDRHVRKGMVAEQGTPEADAASPVGQRVEFDQGGMPVAPKPAPPAEKRAVPRAPADTKSRQADKA